jgi:hypothetical protein
VKRMKQSWETSKYQNTRKGGDDLSPPFRVFSFLRALRRFSIAGLEQPGHSLSAADAHRHDAVFRLAPPHLICNGSY